MIEVRSETGRPSMARTKPISSIRAAACSGLRRFQGERSIDRARNGRIPSKSDARHATRQLCGAKRTGNGAPPRTAPGTHLSDQAPFGERDELTAGDDEMVERAYVDQRQRLLQ